MFPIFLGRVFGLALLITALNYGASGKAYLGSLTIDYVVACVLSFWLLLLDTIWIYPRLRSPLRKLPVVAVSHSVYVRLISDHCRVE